MMMLAPLWLSGATAAAAAARPPPPSAADAAAALPLRVVPCSSWNSGTTDDTGWARVPALAEEMQHENEPPIVEFHHTELGGATTCLNAATATDGVLIVNTVPCKQRVPSQQWRTTAAAYNGTSAQPAGEINIESVAHPGKCLMVAGSVYTLGPGVLLASCNDPDQLHFVNGALAWSLQAARGAPLQTPPQQQQQNLTLVSHAGCCGSIMLERPVCLAPDRTPSCASLGGAPWCDKTLPAAARAAAVVERMTLQEKASNLDSFNFGVPRLALPITTYSEALHGAVGGCGRTATFEGYISTGCPTSFPQVNSLGATWNRSLWTAVGDAISTEVRGLYNQGSHIGWKAGLMVWSPNVNPFRDPRWGRGQEVASEEPLVCGEFGARFVAAMQGQDSLVRDSDPTWVGQNQPVSAEALKTVVAVKHFYDYDMEGIRNSYPVTERHVANVNVSKRDQVEYFSPSFERAITMGRPNSVMCSYTEVNGIAPCYNKAMITDQLRNQWNFSGFVVSDFIQLEHPHDPSTAMAIMPANAMVSDCNALDDGASRRYIATNFNGSVGAQVQQALRAGTDLNCGHLYGENAALAVTKGFVAEADIDKALVRVYTSVFRLGIVDQPDHPPMVGQPKHSTRRESSFALSRDRSQVANRWSSLGPESVDTPEHRALALEAARQAPVLLKNSQNQPHTLPLSQQGLKTIALIGPHANGTTALLGGQNYRGENLLIHSNTPLQRFRAHLQPQGVDVRYAEGCEVLGNDTSKIAAAVQQAKSADIVLLFLGTNGSIENEGIDRQSLELTGKQSQLATAVADAAAKPVIAILFNGGPLAIRELKDNPKVGGIVESFFPGQFGAEALFQLLFGQVSFSGALPVTIYDKDFISRRSIMDHDLRNNGGVTYRYFTGTPLWSFGWSLSYADFEFSANASQVLHTTVSTAASTPLCVEVEVTNTGKGSWTSDVVVLGFITSSHADQAVNPKLFDFVRVGSVRPHEQRTVQLCVDAIGKTLALVNDDGLQRVLPGKYVLSVGVKGAVGGSGAGSQVGTVLVSAQ